MKEISKKYEPTIGNNFEVSETRTQPQPVNTYADVNALKRGLAVLLTEVDTFQRVLEKGLHDVALVVDSKDKRLVESNNFEWPPDLGDIKDRISYRYYKALRFRDTTSAAYIRKRFEEAARDETGSPSLDILSLASIIREEALLVQEFLNAYMGDVSDSSELRAVEQLQDWLLAAVGYTRQLKAFMETRGSTETTISAEIDRLTNEEAKQGQALFKIKLNEQNDSVERDIEFLHRNFSAHSAVFYQKYLGPALNYRLNVTNRALPTGSRVTTEIGNNAAALNQRLGSALTDQMRRRVLFEEKMKTIYRNIAAVDQYRTRITELAVRGQPLPTSGAVMAESQETDEEIDFFIQAEYQRSVQNTDQTSFRASHSLLNDLLADSHPQYLLRRGGELTGHIRMGENSLIDGMRPSTHRHTGADGTVKIHGTDILGGTLSSEVIDGTEKPPAPINLRVLGFSESVVPPGVTTIDADIGWLGYAEFTYEMQVTKLGEVI